MVGLFDKWPRSSIMESDRITFGFCKAGSRKRFRLVFIKMKKARLGAIHCLLGIGCNSSVLPLVSWLALWPPRQ